MRMKIIEWSRRRIHRHVLGPQSTRWKAALAAYMADRLRAYTAAATRAGKEGVITTRDNPAGTEAKNATWWMRPRHRGLGFGTAGSMEGIADETVPRVSVPASVVSPGGGPYYRQPTGGGRAAVFHGGTHMTAAILAQNQTGGGQLTFLISLVLMVGIFYFLLIRPQQRRVRQQRELVDSLAVGDEVVTIGGMFGTIFEMDDEGVTLDVGSGTRIRFVKQAIARKFVREEPESEEADEES
jgi:preprotein translocase subunit YajC